MRDSEWQLEEYLEEMDGALENLNGVEDDEESDQETGMDP